MGGNNFKKELIAVKNRIKKLNDKKALIDEELEPLFIREEELENEEIIAICRKNNITISDLMAKVNRQKAEMKKEKTNENQFEKE
ncbi:conjugal transfer protein [Peptostreptococcus stomatis]